MRWRTISIVAITAVLAIALAIFWQRSRTAHPPVRLDLNAGAAAPTDASRAAPPASDRTLADAVTYLTQTAGAPEPSTFNVDTTSAAVGSDPAALFAYVHDRVRTEIYRGVLRGARGTLMGGSGNAWDQSLLLAAMLRHHGREVRFSRAHLAPDAAAKIVDRMFADAGRARAPGAQTPPPIPDALQQQSRAALASIQTNWQRADADVLGALDRGHVSLGDEAQGQPALASEAADHLFVEYRDGDRWIALDPAGSAAPGTAIAPADQSFPEIPDEAYHHVTIRVTIEERRDQKLERKEVLRYPTTAAALNGEPVLLVHRFDHDLAAQWRATPLLQIAGHIYGAMTFNERGIVNAKAGSKEDLIGQAHQSMTQLGRVTDAFGGAPAPAPAASEFTAESLEVEFTDPSRQSVIVRRELVDRIGIVARAGGTAATAALAPITVTHEVPLQLAGVYACAFASGPIDPSLPMRRMSGADRLLPDLQALKAAHPAPDGSLSAEDRQRLGRVLERLPSLLAASAESTLVLSQRLAARLRAGDASTLFYEASPRMVVASFGPTTGAALDLRRDEMRTAARASSGPDIARANLARSVADAAIESELLVANGRPGSGQRVAAISIFDRARSEGIPLVAIQAGAPLANVKATDTARARMAAVEAGRVLIAPERTPSTTPPRFAWWQLDRSTGDAISVLDTGLNGAQDLPEYAATQQISPLAYEVPPPMPPPISPMAYEVSMPSCVISPMACEVAVPWAQCVEFTEGMMEALNWALAVVGG